ncbi:MAG: ATP-dependent DNA helicase RecG [Anaerolineaceae bacterium]|nr:ATP-dependent DNA helicase RecG [Anaerolineaceae bacterium]
MMQSYLERFLKILRFEASQGYQNRAVTGGLDRLNQTWPTEARMAGQPEAAVRQVSEVLQKYPQYSLLERRQALSGIFLLLGQNPASLPPLNALASPVQTFPKKQAKPANNATLQQKESLPNESPAPRQRRVQAPNAQNLPSVADPVGLNAPVAVIRGVGDKQAKALQKLGVKRIKDLLYLFPRRYEDYSQLKPIAHLFFGEEVTIVAEVQSAKIFNTKHGRKLLEAVVSDSTGSLRLLWFNQDWHLRYLKAGTTISISGKVESYMGRLVIMQPDYEQIDQQQLHTNRIVPVYPLTASISQKWLRKTIYNTLQYWVPKVNEFLPESVLDQGDFIRLDEALRQVHFPETQTALKAAQGRLAFDEIFLLQLGVLRQKQDWQNLSGTPHEVSDLWLQSRFAALPFKLTKAQASAVDDLRKDLARSRPMNRLLQGDVGSGKTAVAALGMQMVIQNGGQAALMAPTSILAEQHARTLTKLLADPHHEKPSFLHPDEIALLTGDTKKKERRELLKNLEEGSLKMLIGTHALIEDPVKFKNLQMVVVDEQHRFGVEQRAALRQKGGNPHLLVMTATPIPRSLQLTVFGDLDVSVMDEMPLGRKPISTTVLMPAARQTAYSLIERQVKEGRQAFIIYPLVEQGENEEAKAAVEEQQRLALEVFPHLRVGLVHGRLKPAEKDEVMLAFRNRQYDILVSTSVVEVGVDVPNATVMVIEGADRFGLAQLHQFRGRVGRGQEQSFCVLIPTTDDAGQNERLRVMTQTTDGFVLAEKDLEQRGPGDFLGTRQAGFADLRMANLADLRLISKARTIAEKLFESDPALESTQNHALQLAMEEFWPSMNKKGDLS